MGRAVLSGFLPIAPRGALSPGGGRVVTPVCHSVGDHYWRACEQPRRGLGLCLGRPLVPLWGGLVLCIHAIGGSLVVCQARGGWKTLDTDTMIQHYLCLEVLPSRAAFMLLSPLLGPPLLAAGKAAYGLA